MPDELLDNQLEGHRALIAVYRAAHDLTTSPSLRDEYVDLIWKAERSIERLLNPTRKFARA